MPFGVPEEFIGLLVVIAVCLIVIAIIGAHEGWFSQRARLKTRARDSLPLIELDQPEQQGPTPHQYGHHESDQESDQDSKDQDHPGQLDPVSHKPGDQSPEISHQPGQGPISQAHQSGHYGGGPETDQSPESSDRLERLQPSLEPRQGVRHRSRNQHRSQPSHHTSQTPHQPGQLGPISQSEHYVGGPETDQSPESRDQLKQRQPSLKQSRQEVQDQHRSQPSHHAHQKDSEPVSEDFVKLRIIPYLPNEGYPEESVPGATGLKGMTQQKSLFATLDSTESALKSHLQRQTQQTQQRAVIVLSPNEDMDGFEYQPPVEEMGPGRKFIPQIKKFNNYIMAKPGKSGQVEQTIMKHFKSLKKAFKQHNNNQDPGKIILYTEVMPSSASTDTIIKTLSSLAMRLRSRVQLYYSLPNCEEGEDTQKWNIERLDENRISVDQIK